MNGERRVAITGLGLVTPAGNNAAATWSTLLEGRSRISAISRFDASGFPVRIAAEVKQFDETAVPADRKLLKFANRSHRFALAAAAEALRDAGIRPSQQTRRRWGCAVGTGMMGMEFADLLRLQQHSAAAGELDVRRLLDDEVALDPMAFCRSQAPAGLSLLLRQFGIGGYATSVHTACASGGQAVGTGMKLIRRGTADWVLAGGFDSMITPIGLAGFCLLNALSPDNEAAPAREPPVRCHAQRVRAGRGRWLPGARGVAGGTPARRAHLRGAGRRRQFAQQLPHHRLAPIGRRPDPVDAAGAGRRRRQPPPMWTT